MLLLEARQPQVIFNPETQCYKTCDKYSVIKYDCNGKQIKKVESTIGQLYLWHDNVIMLHQSEVNQELQLNIRFYDDDFVFIKKIPFVVVSESKLADAQVWFDNDTMHLLYVYDESRLLAKWYTVDLLTDQVSDIDIFGCSFVRHISRERVNYIIQDQQCKYFAIYSSEANCTYFINFDRLLCSNIPDIGKFLYRISGFLMPHYDYFVYKDNHQSKSCQIMTYQETIEMIQSGFSLDTRSIQGGFFGPNNYIVATQSTVKEKKKKVNVIELSWYSLTKQEIHKLELKNITNVQCFAIVDGWIIATTDAILRDNVQVTWKIYFYNHERLEYLTSTVLSNPCVVNLFPASKSKDIFIPAPKDSLFSPPPVYQLVIVSFDEYDSFNTFSQSLYTINPLYSQHMIDTINARSLLSHLVQDNHLIGDMAGENSQPHLRKKKKRRKLYFFHLLRQYVCETAAHGDIY